VDLEIVWGGKPNLVQLDEGTHKVGRAHDNAIQITDARVSKYHATIRVEGQRLFISDLGSTNGTEIDGKPVGKDEVEVPANSTVRFAGAVMRRASDRMNPTTSTFAAVSDLQSQISYNASEGYSDTARDRIVALSSDLFELLAADRNTEELETAACRFVAECVSADRVVMLEDSGEGTSIHPRARWTRTGDKDAPLRLSSTLVGQVLKQRDAVLVANPMEDAKFAGQKSIVDLNLRSAMAAPLFDNLRVRGILYVDTANPMVRYKEDDLQVLTATANAVAVKLRNLSLEKEMRTAARIQKAMLPEILDPPDGYELEAHQVMCRSVGGDLYHCLRRPNGHTFLALGDVAGKGMPAALAMGAAIVLIGLLAEIGGELDELTRHLHRHLFRSFTAEQFLTLFLCELDAETGRFTYVNAGHEPPILVRKGGKLESLENTGMPVAMLQESTFESAEATLEPGDLLTVFSDGIPEATTDGENFLGLEPVEKILAANSERGLPEIRRLITTEVETFLKGEHSSDDVTLMLIRRSS
jgi:serine phosphatase RsbU (regulator of sigma subunit)